MSLLSVISIVKAIDTPMHLLLLHHHCQRQHITTLLAGPTKVVKNSSYQRKIQRDSTAGFILDNKTDNWCVEFLRFNKGQVKEMASLL